MTSPHLMPVALALLAFCVVAETLQQLSFKSAANRATGGGLGLVLQPLIWLGVGLWVIESVAWVLVLQRTLLSLAYPIMTATYATVPLGGLLLLKEPMSGRQRLGAGLIFAGVVCVGMSGL
jgi:drug/metabolite transporter (DMT)-like permease